MRSRNLVAGVYDGEGGFLGLREKLGSVYVFTEYHWDTGPPFGTVMPLVEIEDAPGDIELVERRSAGDRWETNAALERYLVDVEERRLCPACAGARTIWVPDDPGTPDDAGQFANCPTCRGTGLRPDGLPRSNPGSAAVHDGARQEAAGRAGHAPRVLVTDLGAGDPFTAMVAKAVTDTLTARGSCDHDHLVATSLSRARRGSWHDPDGMLPGDREVSWVVSQVLCRSEAYGVIERLPEPGRPRYLRGAIALSDAGRVALGLDQAGSRAWRCASSTPNYSTRGASAPVWPCEPTST